jgi:hypothetical protein
MNLKRRKGMDSTVDLALIFRTNANTNRITIDQDQVYFNEGYAALKLEPGKQYLLGWFVLGDAGSFYEFGIREPLKNAFHLTKILDETGKDTGHLWVRV